MVEVFELIEFFESMPIETNETDSEARAFTVEVKTNFGTLDFSYSPEENDLSMALTAHGVTLIDLLMQDVSLELKRYNARMPERLVATSGATRVTIFKNDFSLRVETGHSVRGRFPYCGDALWPLDGFR